MRARSIAPLAALLLSIAPAGWAQQPAADIEVTTPDGRKVVLRADGTWRHVEPAAAAGPDAAASGPPPVPAELQLVGRSDVPGGCQFQLSLHNRLGYEIRSLVPDIQVVRSGGQTYIELHLGFSRVLPGDTQLRNLRVAGLGCREIEKLQIGGGDRCDMGDLNKYTDGKGLCLARVAVKPSNLVVFEK